VAGNRTPVPRRSTPQAITIPTKLSRIMPSSGMLYRVVLVGTDVSEERTNIRSMLRLLVTANAVPSSPILSTPMTETIRSSETSVLTTATQRNNPEDGIFHSHHRKNLKSYITLTGWALCRRRVSGEVRAGFLYPRGRHSSVTAVNTSNLT
jgi:hypothetical protein